MHSVLARNFMKFIKGGFKMSLLPDWRICPHCHKKYSFNPDVGKFNCPYCSHPALGGKADISLKIQDPFGKGENSLFGGKKVNGK